MKKLLSILLIAIYSTAALGMSVKELYCCGKLSSMSVSFNSDNKKSTDDGCCKTRSLLLKVKDNHLNTQTVAFTTRYSTHSDILLSEFNIVAYSNSQLDLTGGIHGPPLLRSSIPIYILTRNFRI